MSLFSLPLPSLRTKATGYPARREGVSLLCVSQFLSALDQREGDLRLQLLRACKCRVVPALAGAFEKNIGSLLFAGNGRFRQPEILGYVHECAHVPGFRPDPLGHRVSA